MHSTAQKLLCASQFVSWPLLEPTLDKLVRNTTATGAYKPYKPRSPIKRALAGFEALLLLLGKTTPAKLVYCLITCIDPASAFFGDCLQSIRLVLNCHVIQQAGMKL